MLHFAEIHWHKVDEVRKKGGVAENECLASKVLSHTKDKINIFSEIYLRPVKSQRFLLSTFSLET